MSGSPPKNKQLITGIKPNLSPIISALTIMKNSKYFIDATSKIIVKNDKSVIQSLAVLLKRIWRIQK